MRTQMLNFPKTTHVSYQNCVFSPICYNKFRVNSSIYQLMFEKRTFKINLPGLEDIPRTNLKIR